ncbi:hypothetical protein ACWFRM_37600 [Streptomyces sp. NPDC055144]
MQEQAASVRWLGSAFTRFPVLPAAVVVDSLSRRSQKAAGRA